MISSTTEALSPSPSPSICVDALGATGQDPIRAPLFGPESLDGFARHLASCPTIPAAPADPSLLRRLDHNGRSLNKAHQRITVLARRREPLTPDAEWLLDNFYVIEEVLRDVRRDLPRGYYRKLPRLQSGPLAGYPRVYAIGLALVAHTDSSLDEAHLKRFVQVYQEVAPLTIGEIWAVPIMLRLALLENLHRLADQMLTVLDDRERAEQWAHQGAATTGTTAQLPQTPVLTDSFLVRSLHVLRERGPAEAIEKIESELAERSINLGEVVQRENRRQAVNQVSVGNAVTSLRLLAMVDWNVFFERVSRIEALLRDDPAGIYSQQDFATRDRYRRAVEKLARESGCSEDEVTRRVLTLATAAQERNAPAPADHVGYYLIDDGRSALRSKLGYRPRWHDGLTDRLLKHPRAVYFGSILAFTAIFLISLFFLAGVAGSGWSCLFVCLVGFLPASELAVFLTNYWLTQVLPPRVLPKLDLKEGIPPDCASFVVVPCLLSRPGSATELLRRLEIHSYANPDPQLRFALLTDFTDAAEEYLPADETILREALNRIEEMNRRHGGAEPRFFIFHRARRWNAAQGCWMGWERKRGKLTEFNRLLRGDRTTSYTVCSSDPATLPHIRFVITLDADTRLPHDAARRLVGTLAHPLNGARFDPAARRVTAGYSILQPRISYHLEAANRTLFTRIWAASAGVDPYSMAVSDVYQDLFGAGTFTGKGIYEIDAFEAATGQAFPENHILSHDLIEGNFARCGLVTDIELFDDFPSRYHTYARREHRWVRGDWQLLPWLGRTVPVSAKPAHRVGNPLPLLERWKIVDNLRRSLVPTGLVVMLFLGWTVLPGSPWLWSGVALIVMTAPLLFHLFDVLVRVPFTGSLAAVRELPNSAPATAWQVLLGVIFLADQARLSLDAVLRTLVRVFFTRRHMLEWETAAATEGRLGTGLAHFCKSMWPAPALALAGLLLLLFVQPAALVVAAPFLVAWLISPFVAYWVSRPLPRREIPLDEGERQELRLIARKTWVFFEAFVNDEHHWLPPDNYQEVPTPKVAHRTSPTNNGLLLLSTLAAHDFGYLSLGVLVDRLEKTFATFDRLERYRGHFYNWYDTITLEALQPTYVSTVDSGNLVGCLLVLKHGLLEKTRQPWPDIALALGLRDTFAVFEEAIRQVQPTDDSLRDALGLHGPLRSLTPIVQRSPNSLPEWRAWLDQLRRQTEGLSSAMPAVEAGNTDALRRMQISLERFAGQVDGAATELDRLAPWLTLMENADLDKIEGDLANLPDDGPARWSALRLWLSSAHSLDDLESKRETIAAELLDLQRLLLRAERRSQTEWLGKMAEAVRHSDAAALRGRCERLAERADALATATDFTFLYKPDRHLFAIGYQPAQGRLDPSSYDLLASESRLASFLAIARDQAPRRHWFHLGRQTIRADGGLCLVSWGGTMFEYLMPELILPCYPGTLIAESRETAVRRQIEYGRQRGVPWGISESGYSIQNSTFDYQYQAFGVPGLGLKRGLGHDLVVAPYATALAATVHPREALRNLRRLTRDQAAGAFGFYEAIDYTRERLPEGRRSLVVRSYMAHHQGMSLVALANCLLGDPMPRRFHAEPMVRATDLLLQERPARIASFSEEQDESLPTAVSTEAEAAVSRRLNTASTTSPRTHLLSNGRYTVMVTNSGAGFSTRQGMDVSRWREDGTRDALGQFLYIRDLGSGAAWSAGHQPLGVRAHEYEVIFSADKADFHRVDDGITTHLEIAVSPEQDAEVRRLTLTNHTRRECELEVTSYLEVVLAPHAADMAHPAFGKLFLETEWSAVHHALLCHRRPRAPEQKPIWAVHVLAIEGPVDDVQYETDRARFLGRGRTPANPAAMDPGTTLSGTVGAVVDPVFSLRKRVRLVPAVSVTLAFTTAVADSHEQALALADHYRDPRSVVRAFELAWAHTQVQLRHLQLSSGEAHLYQRLASQLLIPGPSLRGDPSAVLVNRLGTNCLWRFGISGDRPLALVMANDSGQLPLIRQLLRAHAYWRLKGLEVDLMILNERPSAYAEELQTGLQDLIRTCESHALVDRPGGIFLRFADQLAEDERNLLQSAARIVLKASRGSLARQLTRAEAPPEYPAALVPPRRREWRPPIHEMPPLPELRFANGCGGFTTEGREYVIHSCKPSKSGRVQLALPPAPWINVVANPSFGFLVSESGSGFTWAGNSQTNRLTPWNNDPVSDPPGEVIYLRDETTGAIWTPTPLPLGALFPTRVRHGQGYSVFEQQSPGLAQELTLFVPVDTDVKILVLRIQNQGDRPRHLSATFFAEWVLGTVREQAPMNVLTEIDAESGALLARNPFNADYPQQLAFADVNLRPRMLTADRTEFLGRNGSVTAPAALRRIGLSGRIGPALDPCAALQSQFELRPGEEKRIVFLLGTAPDVATVRRIIQEYHDLNRIDAALAESRSRWDRLLTTVQIQTPDEALNILFNRWLPYQVLSCRVWGRSAFYQSSGAYGFRDQLQDVMALVHSAPQEARAQILRAAGRQFLEGDVQHWWHPPHGRGVRTHISDDYLWLPFVTTYYVEATGDRAILNDRVPFLTAPLLHADQEDEYGQPPTASESGTLYDHCVRALDHGLRFGAHGLPLMGTGDWNDGMNRVAAGGKGESVWLGWFLLTCLRRFAELVRGKNDGAQAERWLAEADRLRGALEAHAWDGAWYRRAYFDDGTPLGSAGNDECQIDSIAQTWAVLSGVADADRINQAMTSVQERLVRSDAGLILLLTPPFDSGPIQPGYIKGYLPGVRENGGQYTHAATWVLQATALCGQGDRAGQLLDMLNPIRHTSTAEGIARYRVEPYALAGDVYAEAPHVGRGGWTWYTGAAGWFYRVVLETMLGILRHGDSLTISPCVPRSWSKFELSYRHGSATYHIRVENPDGVENGVAGVVLDGRAMTSNSIPFTDDGKSHEVIVKMGAGS
jgi:cyclic beta-1,2-glucan synthetase